MLKSNPPTVIEERLEVLIVIMILVLYAEDGFRIAVFCVGLRLERRKIGKITDTISMAPFGKGGPSKVVTMPIISTILPPSLTLGSMRLRVVYLRAQMTSP